MCADVCTDVCADTCVDMCIDMQRDWPNSTSLGQACTHACGCARALAWKERCSDDHFAVDAALCTYSRTARVAALHRWPHCTCDRIAPTFSSTGIMNIPGEIQIPEINIPVL